MGDKEIAQTMISPATAGETSTGPQRNEDDEAATEKMLNTH